MQFIEGLSDRQAAEAVRSRIDWKYALSLELTDPGFDFSVLCEFRTRLMKGGVEQQLLDLAKLTGMVPRLERSEKLTICYARVSSHDQKQDLRGQIELLESFCCCNGWTYEIIKDLGSGMNCRKPGLRQLIKRICTGDVGRLVLTHKDRLLRY